MTALIGPGHAPLVHVMSFNLRCIIPMTPVDSPDHWPRRAVAVAKVLDAEQPDLVGVQEASLPQLDLLVDTLTAATGSRYDIIGTGREGGSRGEYAAILVRRDRFVVEEWEQFWLSDTPSVVGSTGWGCKTPRIVTWARLTDKATGWSLVIANTHFDWISETVRQRSAELMGARLAEWSEDLPLIATGDFNCDPRSSPVQATLCEIAGLHDLAVEAGADPAEPTSQWYGTPEYDEARIDWILGSRRTRGVRTVVNTTRPDGTYPSDHWPVQALVALG